MTDLQADSIPVKVIKGSQNKILGLLPENTPCNNTEMDTPTWAFNTPEVGQILGTFTVNEEEFTMLKEEWKTRTVDLICGSDGGLKGDIGTSGYVIYRRESDCSLISGCSSERQIISDPSSTRQELLAQLCIEYWINELVWRLGTPRSQLNIHLITDSQASIMMRERFDKVIGIKYYLRSDMDVIMELARQRKLNDHSRLEIHKVRSHIGVEEAENEQYWTVNVEADALATLVRDKVERGVMEANYPCPLPGVKAICMTTSIPWTGDIKSRLYSAVHGWSMKEFLCRKYSWTEQTFHLIDWEAHKSAITKHPKLQQVTIHKYIHGWLATQKRRFREGYYTSPKCILCDAEEDDQHIFCCSHDMMKKEQFKELKKFIKKIQPRTAGAVHSAIVGGVGSMGTNTSAKYRSEFVTDRSIEHAMIDQESIGWEHFVWGRIANKFRLIGSNNSTNSSVVTWAGMIAAAGIEYGMNLWGYRNTLIHSNDRGISKYEEYKSDLII